MFPLSNAVDILSSPNFDQSKKTVIYIHGNNEDQTSVSVKTVVSAYLQRDDYNIIALDWKEDASGEYLLNAVANVMRVNTYDSQNFKGILGRLPKLYQMIS